MDYSCLWSGRILGLAAVLYLLIVPGIVSAEAVERFAAIYTIEPDGQVLVTEDIDYDFSDQPRRGIIRSLEATSQQLATAWYRVPEVDFTVISVTRNGQQEPFAVRDGRSSTDITIGTEQVRHTGIQRYQITYRIRGALTQGPSGLELYWNATGHDWNVPINAVTVTVTTPVDAGLPSQACYQGLRGSIVQCQVVGVSDQIVKFTASTLLPGEGVTIAQALNPAIITYIPLESFRISLLGLPFFFGLLAVWGWHVYRIVVAHRPTRAVIPEYEPYKKLPALFLGTLIDGRLDARDLTAGILQLAQAGHISIAVDPKDGWFDTLDYCIRLNVNLFDLPHGYEFHLLTLLFGSRGVGSEVWISDLKVDTKQQQRNGATIDLLKKELRKELQTQGYLEITPPSVSVVAVYLALVVLPAVAVVYWIFVTNPGDPLGAIFVGIFVFVTFTGLFRVFVGYRRTPLGYEARWHLLGFKQYLSVAEADRLTFHNAPAKNPQEFLDWLPYAVAFGVEKEWAAAFADVTIPTATWYNAVDGTSLPTTQLALSTSLLASNIGSLSLSAAAASFGGGGNSGSGGFGFSGGGGGGGGGRSW